MSREDGGRDHGLCEACSSAPCLCANMALLSERTTRAEKGALMVTIHKFELILEDLSEVRMPQGASVLSIQTQNDRPWIWAKVDTSKPMQTRRFCVRGTGHPLKGDEGTFIATFQLHGGALVFHVFEADK